MKYLKIILLFATVIILIGFIKAPSASCKPYDAVCWFGIENPETPQIHYINEADIEFPTTESHLFDYKYNNINNIIISSKDNIKCTWYPDNSPKNASKHCSAIYQIDNRNWIKLPVSAISQKLVGLEAYSITFNYSDDYKDKYETYTSGNITIILQRKNFTNWKPMPASLGGLFNGAFAIKAEFDMPKDIAKHFDINLTGNVGIIKRSFLLDPNINACGSLATAGETYTLTADIQVPLDTDCITIDNENITLQGAKKILNGTNDPLDTSTAIVINSNNATIMNLTIMNMYAVDVLSNNNVLNFLNITENEGIYIAGAYNTLKNSIITDYNFPVVYSLRLYGHNNNVTNISMFGSEVIGNYLLLAVMEYGFDADTNYNTISNSNFTANDSDNLGVVYFGNGIHGNNLTITNYALTTERSSILSVQDNVNLNNIKTTGNVSGGLISVSSSGAYENYIVNFTNIYFDLLNSQGYELVSSGKIKLNNVSVNRYSFSNSYVDYVNNFGEINFYEGIIQDGTNFSNDVKIINNSAYINESQAGLDVSSNISLNGIKVDSSNYLTVLRNGLIYDAYVNYTSLVGPDVSFAVLDNGNFSIGEGIGVHNINWKTTGGLTASALTYGEVLDYINATCTGIGKLGCNITIIAPDSTIIINNQAMTNGTKYVYTYTNDITLDQNGIWIINITSFTASSSYTRTATIQISIIAASLINGYYGYATENIPSNSTIQDLSYYNYNIIEILVPGVNYADSFCYQESANTTDQTGIDGNCGLNYSGSYAYSDPGTSTTTWDNPQNLNDGDWNTGADTIGENFDDEADFLINYTKPIGATNKSIFKFNIAGTYYNWVLPEACFEQNPIQIKIVRMGGPGGWFNIYCFDGASFQWLIDEDGYESNIYDYPFYEEAMNWSFHTYNATADAVSWSNVKTAIKKAYSLNIKTGLVYDFNLSINEPNGINNLKNNLTVQLPDLLNAPYVQDVVYIKFNSPDGNITILNQLGKAAFDATGNKFAIYSNYDSADLDTSYIVYADKLKYVTATSEPELVNNLAFLSRNTTSRTRIYYNLTNPLKDIGEDYQYKINIPLLSNFNITTTIGNPLVSEMTEGGFVVYNNQSTAQNYTYNLSNASGVLGKDVWDYTYDLLLSNNTNGNITFLDIPAYSFSLIGLETINNIAMESDLKTGDVFSVSAPRNLSENYSDGSREGASETATNPRAVELWDPSYIKMNSLIFYGWLNTTQGCSDQANCIRNPIAFDGYKYVILADKNAPEVNKIFTAMNAGTINISKGVFGYIAVADYRSNASCSNTTWVNAKKAEVDTWLAINESMDIFIDGFDLGDVADTGCFYTDVKNVSNYIKITKGRELAANVFTDYQEFCPLASANGFCMIESCVHKWFYGDESKTTFNYTDQYWNDYAGYGDLNKSVWYATHNVNVLCVPFINRNMTAYQPDSFATGDNNVDDKFHNSSYDLFNKILCKSRVLGYDTGLMPSAPGFNIVYDDYYYDYGEKLQQFAVTNPTGETACMRYSKGTACYNSTSDVCSFDDGRTYVNSSISIVLFDENNPKTYNISINGNLFQIVTAGAGFAYNQYNITLNKSIFDSSFGHYVVTITGSDCPDSGCYVGDDTSELTAKGKHSFYKGGTSWNIDADTTGNHMVSLLVNDVYKNQIDTTDKIVQTNTTLYQSTISTVNSSYTFNTNVWGYQLTAPNGIFRHVKIWNGTAYKNADNYSTSDKCFTANPDFGYSNIPGIGLVGVCVNNLTARVTYPYLNSNNIKFQIDTDDTPPSFGAMPGNKNVAYMDSIGIQFTATELQNNPITWTQNDSRFIINQSGYLTNNSIISKGLYYFNITVNDTDGNFNSTIWGWLNITAERSIVYTYINNTRSNISIANHNSVWLNGTLWHGTGNISLYLNGTLLNNSETRTSNYYKFDTCGIYSVTSNFYGDENFTSANETWYVNMEANVTNTTWTDWYSTQDCAIGQDNHTIQRNKTEYDTQDCGFANVTYSENAVELCYCVYEPINTDWHVNIQYNCSILTDYDMGAGRLYLEGGAGLGNFTISRLISFKTTQFVLSPQSFTENYTVNASNKEIVIWRIT